ncbi:AAWKG family protein [Streptomyces sp. NPDC002309]
MPDRYDPNSAANLDKFDNAGDPSTDTWATLVTHITGYPVPDRKTIFDTLRSEHGGKLFRMDIPERSLSLLVKDSGFLTNKGEDYDIWFFDSGKRRSIMQARIVFEGRVKVGDEIIFASPGSGNVHDAQVREGNEFTDYNKANMSTIPLARYMNGPRAALLALLGGSTADARFSNLGVPDADVVDLKSFTTTGESFDFAAKFFKDHAVVLKDWEDRFGRDDASWKGEAAEVFHSLLRKVRENYDSYVETFNKTPSSGAETATGNTVYSRALSLGRKYLEDSATKLLEAWLAWAKSPYYDPHQVLRYVLDELAQWVDANNVAKTNITSTSTRYTTSVSHSPQAGFSQVHPEYGDLTDVKNWAKVGDAAVRIWSQGVNEYLGKPAAEVQSALNNNFLDLGDEFSDNVPQPKSTSTASEEYEERRAQEEQEEINRQNEENRRYQEELRNEQNQQREEDRRYQDELREEQNRQREEEQRLQEELRNEQNQQREEDRRYQDELREEQRRQQEEAQRAADEQAKAMQESLGGINDPNAVNEQNLGNLDDLLNPNNVVTESLGNLGDVNNPGGEELTNPPPITSNLGNLGGLNSGGGAIKTPTGGSTQFDDGKLTTEFPDGSSSSFDPDTGMLTTTHPDGSTTTTDLSDGVKVTNPDGSVTTLGEDGKLTTTFPDGTTQTVDPATGRTTTTDPDGTTTTQNLGSLGNLNGENGQNGLGDLGDLDLDLGDLGNINGGQDGLESSTGAQTELVGDDFVTTFRDGGKAVFDPDTGMLTSTDADGNVTKTDLTHGAKVNNPDGSTTMLDDGRLSTTFPDGSKHEIDPDTGIATVTDAQGHTETVNLKDLNSSGGRGDLGDFDLESLGGVNGPGGDGTTTRDLSLSDLGLGGSVNTGGASGADGGLSGADGISPDGSTGAVVAPLSDGAPGGAGSPLAPTAGAPGAPGMPGTPGMPMGGTGAGGMGGGERGNGERVRAVLVDAAEESERRNRRRRNPWNRQEDSDTFLAPASRVATTGGDSPEEEAEPGRGATSSADYLEEDADVWGTEEGGTPAVIGR